MLGGRERSEHGAEHSCLNREWNSGYIVVSFQDIQVICSVLLTSNSSTKLKSDVAGSLDRETTWNGVVEIHSAV